MSEPNARQMNRLHQEAIEETAGWADKAEENVDEWGLQGADTLLLAIQEELGELTQSVLEYQHEDGYYGEIYEELDDLGPLLIQLWWALNGHRFDFVEGRFQRGETDG